MPFKVVRNDITRVGAEAVVNASNNRLLSGRRGVSRAIFKAAGYKKLNNDCRKIGFCETGKAVITSGYDLCKYIIHTVGPIYYDEKLRGKELLYSCYHESLELAKSYQVKSIAFPLISAGTYKYPPQEALEIATAAIGDFLKNNEMDIYLVVYDRNSFEISSKLFNDVQAYIDENFIAEEKKKQQRFGFFEKTRKREKQKHSRNKSIKRKFRYSPGTSSKPQEEETLPHSYEKFGSPDPNTYETEDKNYKLSPGTNSESYEQSSPGPKRDFAERASIEYGENDKRNSYGCIPENQGGFKYDIDYMIKHMDKSFTEYLFELIDKSGMTDVEVYRKANIDRRLFSKIKSKPNYKPRKVTVVAFVIALELNLETARKLIERAGYSFTRNNKFDIIIEYFIINKSYDIFEINEVLFKFDQPLIGA